MEQRITTRSAPTWSTHSHFANEYVAALTVRSSIGGTRNPDPVVSGNLSLRKAIVTIAVDAYSLREQFADADVPVAQTRRGQYRVEGRTGQPRLGDHPTVGQPAGIDRHAHQRARHRPEPVSYTHLRAHETDSYLVCRL